MSLHSSQASVSVCPGGQLTLKCDTNSSVLLLVWSIMFNSPYLQHTEMRSIDSIGSAESQAPFFINHTEFQFLRTSVSPLISTMIINNVSIILNRTRVDCTYDGMKSTTFINVIKYDTMTQIQPLVIESENFSFDTISIIVHWEQQDNVLYSPSISPGGEATVRVIGSTRVQARVAYNTQYNLSIIGSFCGQNVTNVIKLHYVRCNLPRNILTDKQFIIIKENYSVHNISFKCNGSVYTITCMENGQWEPDPREIDCRGIPSLTPVVLSGIANLITVLSSITITVCVVSSIVFLFIGYACGWFGHKRKQSRTISDPAKKNASIEQSHNQLPQTPGPLYEELQPSPSTPECQDLVELKENVAYGPITN